MHEKNEKLRQEEADKRSIERIKRDISGLEKKIKDTEVFGSLKQLPEYKAYEEFLDRKIRKMADEFTAKCHEIYDRVSRNGYTVDKDRENRLECARLSGVISVYRYLLRLSSEFEMLNKDAIDKKLTAEEQLRRLIGV